MNEQLEMLKGKQVIQKMNYFFLAILKQDIAEVDTARIFTFPKQNIKFLWTSNFTVNILFCVVILEQFKLFLNSTR